MVITRMAEVAGDVLSLLKGNRKFWVKRIVVSSVPITGYLLFSCPFFIVRLVSGVAFLSCASISASWFIVGSIVDPLVTSLKFRKSTKLEDANLISVVRLSGVKFKESSLKLVKDLDNAFTNGLARTISYGETLYNRQSPLERKVTTGHELGHLATSGLSKRSLISIALAMILLASVTTVVHDPTTIQVIGISVLYLVVVPIHWSAEFNADEFACKLFGPRDVIATLERLRPSERMGIDSDSHPSIARRIRRIKKKWGID